MILRIKEREEAIQLLAMDPQVCGKLLTLHQKGNRVDVEALRDQIPLRQDAGKGPKMGSHGYRRLWWWKSVFVDASGGLGIFVKYMPKNQVREVTRGPQGWGAPYPPWACPPSLWTPCGFSDLHSKSSGCLLVQEKSSRKFYFIWYSFSVKL